MTAYFFARQRSLHFSVLANAALRRAAPMLRRLSMVGLIGLLCACSKTVVLQSNLSDAEANEIVLVLNRRGIEVEKQKVKEGVNLTLNESDLSRATQSMTAAGLPRRALTNLGQEFKKQGMISTPLEERIRYIYGLSQELEYTLQQFDNVIAARVHVVLPERIAPGEPIQPSSAAVFIKYRLPLDEDAIVPRVRQLVASSIPGLSSEDGHSKVSVVMTPSEALPPGIEWTTVGPFMVQVQSAGSLRFALLLLAILAVVGVCLGGFMLLKRNLKAVGWLGTKAPALRRGKS